MENIPTRDNLSEGLPAKTAQAALWFAVLGGLCLLVDQLWLSRDISMDSGASALAGAPTPFPVRTPALATGEVEQLDLAEVDWNLPGRGEQAVPRPKQRIETADPEDLLPFYRELAALEAGQKDRPVRIMHFGDSILTTDELSGQVRRHLHRRFGDAGHGFMLLGKPWQWYHHRDMRHGARGAWDVKTITARKRKIRDGLYGLGGVAFDSRQARSRVWVAGDRDSHYASSVSSYDISYLARPKGGSFDVYVDGEFVETVSTRGPVRRVEHHVVEIDPKIARLELKISGNGPVRLFGVVMENSDAGVVYDSLAINGARASMFERFDEDHLSEEVRRRDPALLVMMLGTNEGHNEHLVLEKYREHLQMALHRLRAGAPEAACLIVGPLDQAKRGKRGHLVSREMPARLTEVQKEVAFDEGCGFFNTYDAMGGKRSMISWYRNGLGSGDFIHPTEYGSRRIGDWLAQALLYGYSQYQSHRSGQPVPAGENWASASFPSSPEENPI